MGWIKPIPTKAIVLRLILGLFAFVLLVQIIVHIRRLTSHTDHIPATEQSIRHLLLRFDSNRTHTNPSLLVVGKLIPEPQTDPLLDKADTKFNVTPVISTGSEDLNFPANVDMPELVRRVLANLSVSVRPINYPSFEILRANSHKCTPSSLKFKSNPDLLVLIKSAPSHFSLRDAIRLGWGDENCWGGRQIVRLFLLGTVAPNEPDTAVRLRLEADLFGDIIQQNFLDHYYNNTYKMMFGLEWAVRFCPNAPLIMFVDDDFFVYPKNVIAYIEGLSEGIRDRLVSGYVWSDAIPIRNNRTKRLRKWYVDKSEFPDARYPPYVAAGNFFLSMPVARELNVAARYTRYLRFDDVFLGIVLKKLARVPIHLPLVHAYVPVNRTSKLIHSMISSHQFGDPVAQLDTWHRLNCSKFCVTR